MHRCLLTQDVKRSSFEIYVSFGLLVFTITLGVVAFVKHNHIAMDSYMVSSEFLDYCRNGVPEKPVPEPIVQEYHKAAHKYNRYLCYRDSIIYGCAAGTVLVIGVIMYAFRA